MPMVEVTNMFEIARSDELAAAAAAKPLPTPPPDDGNVRLRSEQRAIFPAGPK